MMSAVSKNQGLGNLERWNHDGDRTTQKGRGSHAKEVGKRAYSRILALIDFDQTSSALSKTPQLRSNT